MEPASLSPMNSRRKGPVGQLLADNGWAILCGSAATLGVMLGVYFSALAAHVSQLYATTASLACGTLSLVVACPVLSAGGRDWLSSLLRGGIVADAAGVAAGVIWAAQRFFGGGQPAYITFLGVLEIYCLFVVLALACVAAVRCAFSRAGSYAMAALSTAVLLAALASLFWVNGPRQNADPEDRPAIVAAAVEFNPFYSILAPVVEHSDTPWHKFNIMYNITQVGEYQGPPAVRWHTGVVRYGAIALLLTAVAVVRKRFFHHSFLR